MDWWRIAGVAVAVLAGGGLTLVGSLVATRASNRQHRETLSNQIEQKRLELEAARESRHIENKRELYGKVLTILADREKYIGYEVNLITDPNVDDSELHGKWAGQYTSAGQALKSEVHQVSLYTVEVADLVQESIETLEGISSTYWDYSDGFPGNLGNMTGERAKEFQSTIRAQNRRLAGLMRESLNS